MSDRNPRDMNFLEPEGDPSDILLPDPEGGLTVPPLKEIMDELVKENAQEATTAMLQTQVIETLYARIKQLEDNRSELRTSLRRSQDQRGVVIRLNSEITLYVTDELAYHEKFRVAYKKNGLTSMPPEKFKHLFGTTGEAIMDTSMLAKIIMYFEHGEDSDTG